MVSEQTELAQVADLLASAEGEREITLKSANKKVIIKKLNIGELATIMKLARDNEIEQAYLVCFKGLKVPTLTLEQAKTLPLKVVLELSAEIAKFSEIDRGSIERYQNLLTTGS